MNRLIYVAAPWADRKLAKEVAETLEDRGYIITHDWWTYEGEAKNGMDPDDKFMEGCALADMNAVDNCGIFILLNTQKRGEETSGKAVETGIALMDDTKRRILMGEKTNVFHYLDYAWEYVSSVEELLELLKEGPNAPE